MIEINGEQGVDETGRPILKDVGHWLKREMLKHKVQAGPLPQHLITWDGVDFLSSCSSIAD